MLYFIIIIVSCYNLDHNRQQDIKLLIDFQCLLITFFSESKLPTLTSLKILEKDECPFLTASLPFKYKIMLKDYLYFLLPYILSTIDLKGSFYFLKLGKHALQSSYNQDLQKLQQFVRPLTQYPSVSRKNTRHR